MRERRKKNTYLSSKERVERIAQAASAVIARVLAEPTPPPPRRRQSASAAIIARIPTLDLASYISRGGTPTALARDLSRVPGAPGVPALVAAITRAARAAGIALPTRHQRAAKPRGWRVELLKISKELSAAADALAKRVPTENNNPENDPAVRAFRDAAAELVTLTHG